MSTQEKPILFQPNMVASIRAGIKTVTRRGQGFQEINKEPDRYKFFGWDLTHEDALHAVFYDSKEKRDVVVVCPYGDRGTILWVKETHWRLGRWDWNSTGKSATFIPKTDDIESVRWDVPPEDEKGTLRSEGGFKWWKRPSIFMHRYASRIDLRLQNCRPERLHDISDASIYREGIIALGLGYAVGPDDGVSELQPTPFDAWRKLWISINGRESWERNPWNWVASFKLITDRSNAA